MSDQLSACRLQFLLSVLTVLTSQRWLTCDGFPTHAPTTVCESLMPVHYNPQPNLAPSQPINTSPYRMHVSNMSYTPGAMMTLRINGTAGFKVS